MALADVGVTDEERARLSHGEQWLLASFVSYPLGTLPSSLDRVLRRLLDKAYAGE